MVRNFPCYRMTSLVHASDHDRIAMEEIMSQALKIAMLAVGLLSAAPAAADIALLVGNARYENISNLRDARFARQAEAALRLAGFDVYAGSDVDAASVRNALSEIVQSGEDTRILILLSGHFAQSGDGETWFLGVDASRPDRGDIGEQAVALSTIMAVAAAAPGRAIVLLGSDEAPIPLGPGLAPGVALPDPPQGVAVVVAPPRQAARIARENLTQSGASVAQALESEPDLAVAGFVPDYIPFLDAPADAATTPLPSPPVTSGLITGDRDDDDGRAEPVRSQEDQLWAAVQELNTEGAYISYLQRYPTGRYASQARAAFDNLRDPVRIAAEEESALGFDRSDRREIQSDLTVLGFDTNGIDGIFGNGTRSAIRGWQASIGLAETGHLNAASLRRLSAAADIRREELAAEEAIRQAERDRLDRAYWNATGRGTDEAGLRAYLARYPEGLFADVARDQLDELEGARAEADAAEEDAAWDFATRQDSIRAYRGYLAVYPEGAYMREARNRIAELRGQPQPFPEVNTAELEAQEAALNLPSITRMLIERRLSDQGYNPGTADGRFDAQTREAIHGFQTANGLTPTGYLDRATVARFLSDGFQIILR